MKNWIFSLILVSTGFITNAQNTFPATGNVGIGTSSPSRPLEIKQEENPNTDGALMISEPNNGQKIYLHLADNANGEYGYFHLGGTTNLRGNGQPSSFDGSLGLGTTSPAAPLEIKQKENPSSDRALMISEPNNSQKIYLHLADNASGEYGYFHLGGTTNLRGNGQPSSFDGSVGFGTTSPAAPLEIKQKENPSSDRALMISEPNNSQKIYLHLADNANGEYGYFHLGGTTNLRGNGQPSSFDGSLAIGTTNTGSHKLAVEGSIGAREVVVETGTWSDFVFYNNYELPTLEEVENHIKQKGHLKGIPNANEVKENGINLGEMDAKLLQKIEELTLYIIQMNKRISKLEKENQLLKK